MLRIFEGKNCVITAAAAACVIVLAVLAAIFLPKPGQPPEGGEEVSAESIPAIEAQAVADDTADPENLESEAEHGAEVKSEEIKAESGRSMGIDVSKWQGKIDWKRVKTGGVEFAFIRIGFRGENGRIYKDTAADYNIQQAQKSGIKVGVYFFSTAVSVSEAKEEAAYVKSAIEGYAVSYPVVFDCEGFLNESSRMHSLSAAARTDNALAFLSAMKGFGYDAMLYGAASELSSADCWETARIEKDYKIWVAHYPQTTYPQKERPDYEGRVDAWQYTNKGIVPGISGGVDLVVCYFTKSEAKPQNPNAAPTEAPPPKTPEEQQYTDVNETVTAKDEVNLRKSATTKSEAVASLKNGETAKRIGIGLNGWSKLEFKGQILYAISSYLTTDLNLAPPIEADVVSGNTFTAVNDSVTAKDTVNLRALPSTASEIVGSLKSGEFLSRTAKSDKGWSRLILNGREVYAVTSLLTDKAAAPQNPPAEDDGFASADEQVTAKEETNLRSRPSTSDSEIIYTLKNGEYIRRIGIHSNGWSKLEYNGQTVYAISSYLTK